MNFGRVKMGHSPVVTGMIIILVVLQSAATIQSAVAGRKIFEVSEGSGQNIGSERRATNGFQKRVFGPSLRPSAPGYEVISWNTQLVNTILSRIKESLLTFGGIASSDSKQPRDSTANSNPIWTGHYLTARRHWK